MTFGDLLAFYRGKTGLTQKELADQPFYLRTTNLFMIQAKI